MPEPRNEIEQALRKSGTDVPPTNVAGTPIKGPTAAPAGSASLGHGYQVQEGDSLSKIAKRIYGDASQWKRIWEANKATIPDPDLIHPGQQITLPPK